MLVLKQANVIPGSARSVKVYLSGEVTRAITVQGMVLSKGARAAIEAAGGKIAE
jgi:large subunit ribosomal protein L15